MPLRSLTLTRRVLCALLGSLAACGARSALDSTDYQASGGVAQTQNSGGAGPAIDPAVCIHFAPLWDNRATATTLVCDTCLRDGGCGWPSDAFCLSGTRCVDRRCSVLGDLNNLCACIESCFPDARRTCDDRWSAFMSCAANTCEAACR